MKSITSEGMICIRNKDNTEFRVCKITYIQNEDETFRYIFTPDYDVIGMTDSSFFQGIPGLNLDLHKPMYIRENMTPVFISERVPQPNREDYHELLAHLGMEYMNPIEYLIKTDMHYSGDKLYVVPMSREQIRL